MANQILALKLYKWSGLWVFDDDKTGLEHEALVGGMPTIIEMATAQANIIEPERGFLVLFSKDPFPDANFCLNWVRQERGGNVYSINEQEGWLCPALFLYFPDGRPEKIYIQVRDIPTEDKVKVGDKDEQRAYTARDILDRFSEDRIGTMMAVIEFEWSKRHGLRLGELVHNLAKEASELNDPFYVDDEVLLRQILATRIPITPDIEYETEDEING